MGSGIKLSPQHGVNPALLACAICGADAGLALMGRLPQDAEAPKRINDGHTLCNECQGVMDQDGGMLIEVRDRKSKLEEPYRTGQIWGLKKEAFDRLGLEPEQRVAYIEQSEAKALGLKAAA